MTGKEVEAFIATHFSKEVRKRLKDADDYDEDGFAIWQSRTDFQDVDGPSKITNISYSGNDWHHAEFLDMGHKGHKDFVIKEGIITRYK